MQFFLAASTKPYVLFSAQENKKTKNINYRHGNKKLKKRSYTEMTRDSYEGKETGRADISGLKVI